MYSWWEEITDEVGDFFEDLGEHLFRRHPTHARKPRPMVVNGVITSVRPAYLFAERVDNCIKILFGGSIAISAFTSTFLGFASLSELLKVLVNSIGGRILMLIIGLSYLITALWKLLHLTHTK